MGVTVNGTAGELTWDSSLSSWDSTLKTWDGAYNTDWDVVVAVTAGVNESKAKSLQRAFSDALGFVEYDVNDSDYERVFNSSPAISDFVQRLIGKSQQESVGVEQDMSRNIGKSILEAVGTLVNFARSVQSFRTLSENVGFKESFVKELIKRQSDSLNLGESYNRSTSKGIDENLEMVVERDDPTTFGREFATGVSINESVGKHYMKFEEAFFSVNEFFDKGFIKGILEAVSMVEEETDPSDYRRYHTVNVRIAEAVAKTLNKAVSSGLELRDFFVRPHVVGVVSDIGLRNIAIAPEEVEVQMSQEKPQGFTNWEVFQDGDYYYKEALFKLWIKNLSPSDVSDVKITAHKIICDVQDVFDKGTSGVSSSGSRIYFNRVFHNIPVVSVTSFNTAEFAIPEITDIQRDYFEVRLKKMDDTNAVGSITWNAQGY